LIGEAQILISDPTKIKEDGKKSIPSGDVIIATGRSISYVLPSDFYMYLRSVS